LVFKEELHEKIYILLTSLKTSKCKQQFTSKYFQQRFCYLTKVYYTNLCLSKTEN